METKIKLHSSWRCPKCGDEKYSKEDTIIKICYVCQIDMVKLNEVEDELE